MGCFEGGRPVFPDGMAHVSVITLRMDGFGGLRPLNHTVGGTAGGARGAGGWQYKQGAGSTRLWGWKVRLPRVSHTPKSRRVWDTKSHVHWPPGGQVVGVHDWWVHTCSTLPARFLGNPPA